MPAISSRCSSPASYSGTRTYPYCFEGFTFPTWSSESDIVGIDPSKILVNSWQYGRPRLTKTSCHAGSDISLVVVFQENLQPVAELLLSIWHGIEYVRRHLQEALSCMKMFVQKPKSLDNEECETRCFNKSRLNPTALRQSPTSEMRCWTLDGLSTLR